MRRKEAAALFDLGLGRISDQHAGRGAPIGRLLDGLAVACQTRVMFPAPRETHRLHEGDLIGVLRVGAKLAQLDWTRRQIVELRAHFLEMDVFPSPIKDHDQPCIGLFDSVGTAEPPSLPNLFAARDDTLSVTISTIHRDFGLL
ncbi:hypothetical protein [Roseovarius sp. C03]|uniref:hypothetical protein n=1 Tax=Roseovarius sp. C03 TaxID=3449222 RepID=UPI003EDBEA4D